MEKELAALEAEKEEYILSTTLSLAALGEEINEATRGSIPDRHRAGARGDERASPRRHLRALARSRCEENGGSETQKGSGRA